MWGRYGYIMEEHVCENSLDYVPMQSTGILQSIHASFKPDNNYILLDVLLCSIAEYFYELCRILASL